MTQAAENAHLVLLELHPRPAAVAEPAAGKSILDVGRHDLDAGGKPLKDPDQRLTVRLT